MVGSILLVILVELFQSAFNFFEHLLEASLLENGLSLKQVLLGFSRHALNDVECTDDFVSLAHVA